MVAVVAALVVAGVVMLVVRPFASAPVPTVAASPTQGVLDIASTLYRQAVALVAGDEQGWLAPVSSRNQQLQAEYRKQFKQLRALGVTSFQPVYDVLSAYHLTCSFAYDLMCRSVFGELSPTRLG